MLTQLSTVKARCKLDEFDVADDVLLTNFIKHATDRFNRECNRLFARAVDATYEFDADRLYITPPRFPIESITAFHLKTDETEGWVAQADVSYTLRKGGEVPLMICFGWALGLSDQVARITYTGGYVLPGGTVGVGQTALPDAIEQACIEQVTYWYQRKDTLGLTSVQGEGGTIQQFAGLDLLPHVRVALKSYERWLP